jgi:arginine deiminase
VRVYTPGSRERELEGDEMVATVPHYALEQARDAAHGGDGWLSREETTAAGAVVMPAGNPVTRAALEANGVTCLEVEVDELMKGTESVYCMTGVVPREAV